MTDVLARLATLEVVPSRTARRAILVTAFAILTALGAHLAVPLPGGVPVTMQTLFVTLAGAVLGPYLGAASQAVYLIAGIAGMPVFAMGAGPAYLLGPTGGYLLSYPLAAALTGLIAGRAADAHEMRGIARIALAMLIASLFILALGAAQLSLLTADPVRAFRIGVLPFLVGDLLKVALGALIAHR
ncbi:MAG TPA: biotin transporter BioY, partial [Longimicrobiales bacterium]|nr:biotin transporter BioY [Longimicrobiales bacterium]